MPNVARPRHPLHSVRYYLAMEVMQVVKADHQAGIRGPGQLRRIQALVSHLELAGEYNTDALGHARALLDALSGGSTH